MGDNAYDVDPELLAGFIDDSEEALSTLDSLFVKLEQEPSNLDIIAAIFRPVHSMKGNSAFFGLLKVKALAHELETLLDLARKQKLTPTRGMINVLLAGVDQLKEMMARARLGQAELEDEASFNELLAKVIAAKEGEDTASLWRELTQRLEEIRANFAQSDSPEARELEAIAEITSRLMPEKTSTDRHPAGPEAETPSAVCEALRRINVLLTKAREETLADEDTAAVLTSLNALKNLAKGEEASTIIEKALDEYHTFADSIGFDPLLSELLQEKVEALISLNAWKMGPDSAVMKPGEKKSQTSAYATGQAHRAGDGSSVQPTVGAAKHAQETVKTMRVREERVDRFLSYVGELIVVGEMLRLLENRMSLLSSGNGTSNDFHRVNNTFAELSNNLRKSIMEIRKIPVNTMLRKAPRLVRDIAASSGKEISVELQGEEIEIDKGLIDALEAPLTHMLRNAADHGIEMPDIREASGKNRNGTVRIIVSETTDDIVLRVSDDGKGLDYEAIKSKAISLGLAKAEQRLTDNDVASLLFASGVSTSEKATDVSGRGVGMDVVRRNIDGAGGKIMIKSAPGEGTEFCVQLPKSVSTQIVDGFLIKAGDARYVLPLNRIRESFRPDHEGITDVFGKGQCVQRHGKLIAVVPLAEILGHSTSLHGQAGPQTMIALSGCNTELALSVDEILGVQQVVIKHLDGLEMSSSLFVGGAIMGDGTVSMVLDVDGICALSVGA